MKQDVASIELSAAEFGRCFGISGRRVRELRDEGKIPASKHGRFNLVAAGSALAGSMRLASGRAAAGGAASAEGLDQARSRLARERADGVAMRNRALRGELVPIADVSQAVCTLIDVTQSKLDQVARKVAPTDARLRQRIADAIAEALTELSETRVVEAAPAPAGAPGSFGTAG